ncbi:MAG: UxaA family hydrolase [Candidatus Desulforudis sp.]|nr:UxaA family hydrolase [Desulforudis sp.]
MDNGVRFFVHHAQDTVGVAVSDIQAGEIVEGWVMDENKTVRITALSDIPLGHKIALSDISPGDPVIKYNVPICLAISGIKAGEHVHVHNVKSARW